MDWTDKVWTLLLDSPLQSPTNWFGPIDFSWLRPPQKLSKKRNLVGRKKGLKYYSFNLLAKETCCYKRAKLSSKKIHQNSQRLFKTYPPTPTIVSFRKTNQSVGNGSGTRPYICLYTNPTLSSICHEMNSTISNIFYKHKISISFKYWSQIWVSEHFSFAEIIHTTLQMYHIKMLMRQHCYCTGMP